MECSEFQPSLRNKTITVNRKVAAATDSMLFLFNEVREGVR